MLLTMSERRPVSRICCDLEDVELIRDELWTIDRCGQGVAVDGGTMVGPWWSWFVDHGWNSRKRSGPCRPAVKRQCSLQEHTTRFASTKKAHSSSDIFCILLVVFSWIFVVFLQFQSVCC
jgi:hypothetical protein